MGWKIETFHKILKSGCKAEESKLRTCGRLANIISVYCIMNWRMFWLTMLNRTEPEAPSELALTKTEILILNKLLKPKAWEAPARRVIDEYLKKIARLGGDLARARDLHSDQALIRRDMARLIDIQLGWSLAVKAYG
jgi:hypothetical protein